MADEKEFGIDWKDLVDVNDYEIWRAGKTVDGRNVSESELDEVVSSFADIKKVGYEAPIIVGHNAIGSKQEKPAVGFIHNVKKVGTSLFADIKQVPKEIANMMTSGFKNRSVELAVNARRDGKTYPLLLKAVALLGSSVPAFAGLGQQAKANPYSMESDSSVSFEIDFSNHVREDKLTVEELQKQVDELTKQLNATSTDKTAKEAELKQMEAKLLESQNLISATQKEKAVADSKAKFSSLLSAKKIFPAQATAFVSLYNALLGRKEEKTVCFEAKEKDFIETKEEKSLLELFEGFINSIPESKEIVAMFSEQAPITPASEVDENLDPESHAFASTITADEVVKYCLENKLDIHRYSDYQKALGVIRSRKENK